MKDKLEQVITILRVHTYLITIRRKLHSLLKTFVYALKDGLIELKRSCPFIGDVRGIGLFLGVELVKNLETKEPGTSEANYICNRLKENRILVGLEGPFENIIKIRPPLTLVPNDIEAFLYYFKNVLSESYLKHSF